MSDRLMEIETRWAIIVPESARDAKLSKYAPTDIAWLIAEVKRLRAEEQDRREAWRAAAERAKEQWVDE